MAEEPSEASVSSISIEDDVEPSDTRENFGIVRDFWKILGIFRDFWRDFREELGISG